MSQLIACQHCSRHLRISEQACPFCGASVPKVTLRTQAIPRGRATRAAMFAVGATVASCSDNTEPGTTSDASSDRNVVQDTGAQDTTVTDSVTSDVAATDAVANSDTTTTDAITDTGVANDGTADVTASDGSMMALYGAPPAADSGKADADDPVPAPLYGAPPPPA